MIKIKEIIGTIGTIITCRFSNNEVKAIDLNEFIDRDRFIQKIIETDQISLVKIGDFGQLYWPAQATMRDVNGIESATDYDVSPEFVYIHSKSVEPSLI